MAINRNAVSQLNMLPSVHTGRSRFILNDTAKKTFNIGDLHLIDYRLMVPGDQFKIKESYVVRTQPLVAPIMDDIEFDTYHFFVRCADLWDHFKNFVGESTSKWRDEDTEYTIPKISFPSTGTELGTLFDDMNVRPGLTSGSINALPIRAYAKVVNDWFRNSVTEDEIYIPTGDSDIEAKAKADYDYVNGPAYGLCYKVNRKPNDRFALASIEPQRGPAVQINLGDLSGHVFGSGKTLALTDNDGIGGIEYLGNGNTGFYVDDFNQNYGHKYSASTQLLTEKSLGVPTQEFLKTKMGDNYDPLASGLIADVQGAGIITINELRNAFAVQRYYEALSLYGNSYQDIIKALFNVETPDSTIHKAIYIGGSSKPIQVYANYQTSSTDTTTPQGNAAGYSVTGQNGYIGEYAASEYGIYLCVGVARYKKHTYQQGISKFLLADTFFDIFSPQLDSLGDEAIKNAEIYLQDSSVIGTTGKPVNDEVFGYQERWYDYRNGKTCVSGQMRSDATTPLDKWHLADYYESLPTLTEEWQREDPALLDRCLAVTSDVADQMFGDFLITIDAIRPMAAHSIPGAIIR